MTTLRTFQKITTQDSDINKLQTNLSISLDPLIQLQPQTLLNVSLTQGIVNKIPHNLGRVAVGFNIINRYSQSDIWTAQKADNLFVYINCNTNVVVDLQTF